VIVLIALVGHEGVLEAHEEFKEAAVEEDLDVLGRGARVVVDVRVQDALGGVGVHLDEGRDCAGEGPTAYGRVYPRLPL